jgi:hypothetical protein
MAFPCVRAFALLFVSGVRPEITRSVLVCGVCGASPAARTGRPTSPHPASATRSTDDPEMCVSGDSGGRTSRTRFRGSLENPELYCRGQQQSNNLLSSDTTCDGCRPAPTAPHLFRASHRRLSSVQRHTDDGATSFPHVGHDFHGQRGLPRARVWRRVERVTAGDALRVHPVEDCRLSVARAVDEVADATIRGRHH